MNCTCSGWLQYYHHIRQAILEFRKKYGIEIEMNWKFCPWCGKELVV